MRLSSPAEAGLSPNARLYVATGSPLLFRRAGRLEQLHFDASWLYVPAFHPSGAADVHAAAVSDVALGGMIDLEDWAAYPIVAGGETVGQIVLPRNEEPHLDQDHLVTLAGSLSTEFERDTCARPAVSELFVRNLFQRDAGPQQFTKRLLSLLSLEWPGSCAGTYVEYQGMHHLLLATGEVSRYYRLTRQLPLDKATEFAAACARKQPFLPAELLPDQATFLTSAPDLFYVHAGWQSERSPQYIVVVGPGDLGRRIARRLREICALTSSLHESQFITTTEVFDEYQQLSRTAVESTQLNAILSSTVERLGKQMQLSRIGYTLFNGDNTGTNAHVFLTCPNGETTHAERDSLDIPDAVIKKIREGQPELIPDLTSGGLSETQSRQRYLDNVVSEYCMPVETSRGVVGVLALGSSVAGDYLARAVPTASAVAGLVSLWCAMEELVSKPVEPCDVINSAPDTGVRLSTIRRLAESHLHGLSESVSAAIGQAELLRDARRLDDPVIEAQRQSAAAETLCAVADGLDAHLSGLRQVCALTVQPDSRVNCSEAMSAIPAVMAGLIRHVKDSKNIDLQIETDVEPNLIVSARDLYDYLVPFVMTVVEQAICSGRIALSARGNEHTVTFSVRFRQRLLGGLEVPRLLTELYPHCELILQDSGSGQMIVGESTLIFQSEGSDGFLVSIDCIRRETSDPPGNGENQTGKGNG